jgi:hypothetical protein
MRSRRLLMPLAVIGMVVGVMAPALAHGVDKAQLDNNGWFCFEAGPVSNWHCQSPNSGQGAAASAMVFSPGDGDEFLGTESLRFTSKDLTSLPCPKAHDGHWEEIPGMDGVWACHHWKGAPDDS